MSFAAGSPAGRPASNPASPSQPLDLASVGGAVPADRDSESECIADLLPAVAKSATSGLTEPQAGPLPLSEMLPAVATSGLAEPSVGPLPPSPAGAHLSGCIGPCGPPSPPSIVPSLDFSQGFPLMVLTMVRRREGGGIRSVRRSNSGLMRKPLLLLSLTLLRPSEQLCNPSIVCLREIL